MKVGLVGLGRMGAAMAGRLAEMGHEVAAWDIKPPPGLAPGLPGFRLAAGPREVARAADLVISIITEDHGVRNLFTGPDGFLSADVRGKLFVEMSTLQPATGRELASVVAGAGAALIEAPVLGSVPTVREGKLVALAGGDADDVERARDVLQGLTRRIVHMGPNGSGYAMKLAVNLGLAAYIQALAEALALGERQGFTLETMLDVLAEAPYASPWLKGKTGLLMGEKADTTLDIRSLRKDILSALTTGAQLGVPMPGAAGAAACLSAAVANGWGEKDCGELPRFVREQMVQRFG